MRATLFILSILVYTASYGICGKLKKTKENNFYLKSFESSFEVRVDSSGGVDRAIQLKKQLVDWMQPDQWNGEVCFKGFANYYQEGSSYKINYTKKHYILYSDDSDISGNYQK